METLEKDFKGTKISGFLALFIIIVVLAASIWSFSLGYIPLVFIAVCCMVLCSLAVLGFMVVEPNEARVMVFFGKYKGTITDNGFLWVNPFYYKKKLTL